MTSKTITADTIAARKARADLAAGGIHLDAPSIAVGELPEIETVAETDLGKLAAEESFMAEPVVVRVHTTTDVNAAPFVDITVNDSSNRVRFHRGVAMRVKRQHLEVLARMKETRYRQAPAQGSDLESGNALIPSESLCYPFEVLEDKNPAGRAWLERVLAERS